MRLAQTRHPSYRTALFLALLALIVLAGVMLARPNRHGLGIYVPGGSDHPAGDMRYPHDDCGHNYFLFVKLPGDVCMQRADSAAKVEEEMERIDPTINETPIGPESAWQWQHVVYQALKNLGWSLP